MKASIKVGLDIGASRVKASFLKGKEVVDIAFPNRVDTSLTASGIRVELDGEAVTVGTVSGYSNSINKKINYHNLHHIIFAVAHKIKQELELAEDSITLDINTVLPPQEYRESREAYKELIASASCKMATVAGEPLSLIINSVKVGAEGVSLLNACNLDKVAKDLDQVLLLDVGSSTTDIVVLTKDQEAWKIKNAITSRVAGSDFCKSIETELNSGTGLSYTWDELEHKQSYQLDGKKYEITEKANAITENVNALIADLSKIGNVRQYKVILAGAGSRILRENETFKAYTNFSCIDDSLLDFGNSRGVLKA